MSRGTRVRLTHQAASRLGDRRGKIGTVWDEPVGNSYPVLWDGEATPVLYSLEKLEPVYMEAA